MTTLLLVLFIVAALPLAILAIYPIWSWMMSGIKQNTVSKSTDFQSSVSIVIACYNEEHCIGEKIESLLSPANWIPGSELIVVSGGSTDRTEEILLTFKHREGVRIELMDQRTTKIDGVNHAVNISKNDLLVFSDCRQKMKDGSIQQLIQNFHDQEVGTVSASLNDANGGQNRSFFRSMYDFMASNDSRHSSCLNVYGALYAQRKSVYRKIPSSLLFDDLFVVVSTLSQKKRVLQEKEAVIYDVNFNSYYEKERIRRLVRGLLIFLFHEPSLIFSLSTGTLIRFLIYKYLKILMPYLLILLSICAALFPLHHGQTSIIIGIGIGAMIILLRKHFMLFVRINYHILIASFAYLIGTQRSNEWEKLKTNKPV